MYLINPLFILLFSYFFIYHVIMYSGSKLWNLRKRRPRQFIFKVIFTFQNQKYNSAQLKKQKHRNIWGKKLNIKHQKYLILLCILLKKSFWQPLDLLFTFRILFIWVHTCYRFCREQSKRGHFKKGIKNGERHIVIHQKNTIFKMRHCLGKIIL